MKQRHRMTGRTDVSCLLLMLLVIASLALPLLPSGRNSGQVLAENTLSIAGAIEWQWVWEGHYSEWIIGDCAHLITATVTLDGSPASGVSVVADITGPTGEGYWLRDGTQMLYDTVQGKGMDESGWKSGSTYGGGIDDGIYANFLELDASVSVGSLGFFANHAGTWRIRLTASKEGYDSASTELTLDIEKKTGNFGHNFNFIDLDSSTLEEDWVVSALPGQTLNAKLIYDETNPCAGCCVFYIRAWGCQYEEWGDYYDIDSGCTDYRSNVERTWTYIVPTTPGTYTITLADNPAYWWPFYGENVGFVGRLVVGGGIPDNPPDIPSNPWPTNHAPDASIHANLSWTGGDPDGDSVTYDVYFEKDDSSPDRLVSDDQSGTSCDPETLDYNSHYYWQIEAKDQYGETRLGPVWDFTTWDQPNDPPYLPSNPSPPDGEANVSLNADLSWSGGDPDSGDTVTYDVYFGTSASPPRVSNGQWGTTYDLGTPVYSTKYYWKVVATDNNGASTTGPVWDFVTIACPTPGTPSLVSPSNGQGGVSTTPTLEWSDVSSATSYVVEVLHTGSGGHFELISHTVDGRQWTVSPTLSPGTQYFWRVRAENSCGSGLSSSEWTFTTQTPGVNNLPATPSNQSPANQATGVSLTHTLQSSVFSDPDDGDSHNASQWQITTRSDDYSSPVFDRVTDTVSLTQTTIPSGILDYSTTYYWRVRHQDSHEEWSEWSEETQFKTEEPSKGWSSFVLPGVIVFAGIALLGIILGSRTLRMKRNIRRWEEEGYDLSDWK